MASLDQHLANIRQVWLDEPLPQRPGLRYLWTLLLAEVQNAFNQMTDTGQNWRTGETTLEFGPSQEEVQIPDSGMSKPLVVYTMDEANPHHYERVVDIVSRQNLITGYYGNRDGGGNLMPYFDSYHTAQKIAIYQKDGAGDWYASVRPVPASDAPSAVYKLIFADGAWAENAQLGSSVALTEHGQLFEVRAATLALSQAVWWADDEEKNAAKRKEKLSLLALAESRYGPSFDRFITSLSGHKVSFRRSNW